MPLKIDTQIAPQIDTQNALFLKRTCIIPIEYYALRIKLPYYELNMLMLCPNISALFFVRKQPWRPPTRKRRWEC